MASACWKQVFILTNLFNIVHGLAIAVLFLFFSVTFQIIVVSDFRVNEFTRFSRVLIITELVVNGNQCIILSTGCYFSTVIVQL